MRRISIDTIGMISPTGTSFGTAKRKRSPWYVSRPRLVATCCLFAILYLYLDYGSTSTLIPRDSNELLKDPSLTSILNSTLGFDKILVLNLPYRTDRRDSITLAAATSNIKLEFVDGVTGDSIRNGVYPPPEENIRLPVGIRGSWRTHMNALLRVVDQNLTTALILEDDVDWDIRLRPNLQRFALASRFLSENKNTLSSPAYPLTYVPNPETAETSFQIIPKDGITKDLPSLPLSSVNKTPMRHPRQPSNGPTSPYGNPSQWDILWIGHCGAGFPRHLPSHAKPETTTANVLLTHHNDQSVPSPKWLKAHPFQGDLDPLATAYPAHTRVYHRASGGQLCTVGYAVSQRGARRLLHQFALKAWNGIFDSELGRWCAGQDPQTEAESHASNPQTRQPVTTAKGGNNHGNPHSTETERVCLTSQPPIFAHHHAAGGQSDIGGLGGGYASKYETKYLRYSVMMNLERIVQGVKDLVDQWPDE